MSEATIERVAKHLAASNGDPSAWGAYAHQAMEVIELAEDQWEPIETAPLWRLIAIHDSASYKTLSAGPVYSAVQTEGGAWPNELSAKPVKSPTHWRPLPKPPKT